MLLYLFITLFATSFYNIQGLKLNETVGESKLRSRTYSNDYSDNGPLGLEKTSPDLQFGLAFTVPFVSLSTDKLLNKFGGGKSENVSNILKLNLSGLVIAAIVGIAAFLFIPGIIGAGNNKGGAGGGWGGGGGSGMGGILDSILPPGLIGGVLDHLGGHHGGQNNNNVGGGYYDEQQNYYNRKDSGLFRSSRSLNGTLTNMFQKYGMSLLTKGEDCMYLQVCRKVLAGNKKSDDLLDLIESFTNNDLIKNNTISLGIKNAQNYAHKNKNCKAFINEFCQ